MVIILRLLLKPYIYVVPIWTAFCHAISFSKNGLLGVRNCSLFLTRTGAPVFLDMEQILKNWNCPLLIVTSSHTHIDQLQKLFHQLLQYIAVEVDSEA